MSLTSEQRKTIKLYMLRHIDSGAKHLIPKTAETFGISRTSAYSYIKRMIAEGAVELTSGKTRELVLTSTGKSFTYTNSEHLQEDMLFERDIKPLLCDYPENVYDIIKYVYTEIMNNAIEHSNAKTIACFWKKNAINTYIMIIDDGIGIFRNIQSYYAAQGQEISPEEAVDALFPGKLTTKASGHSGEGIFFSSRAADEFFIVSDRKCFSLNKQINMNLDFDAKKFPKGTCVVFSVANDSTKQLKRLFNVFTTPEKGFFKTHIPIARFFSSGYPVTRSEARRLTAALGRFEEAILDFKDVPELGQAFAHELFVAFQNSNENIRLTIVNTSESVRRMISRVRHTK